MNQEMPCKKLMIKIFNTLSTESRLSALELFEQSQELNEVAKSTGMSRSGFQKVIESFRDFELIEKAGHRSCYKLSRRGRMILQLVREFSGKLKSIEIEYEKLRVREAILHSPLTLGELEELIKEIEEKSVKEGNT